MERYVPTNQEFLNQLVGRQLSSVEFVTDYFQLRFDGPTINVTSDVTLVCSSGKEAKWGDEHFRNLICGQIAKLVSAVVIKVELSLDITFEDGSLISVSLRPADQSTAEAVYFHGFENDSWGVA